MKELGSLREEYLNKGFVKLDGFLSQSELSDLQNSILNIVRVRTGREGLNLKDLDTVLTEKFQEDKRNVSFVYDVARNHPLIFRAFSSGKLLEKVGDCLGCKTENVVYNNVNVRIDMQGPEWTENLPWHQDWPYDNPLYVKGQSLACWIALFDVDEELGALSIVPESHKYGQIKHEEVEFSGNSERKNNFLYRVPDRVMDELLEPVVVPCKAGDVLLFDLNTVHASGTNKTDHGIRWSSQARYHDISGPGFLSRYDIG